MSNFSPIRHSSNPIELIKRHRKTIVIFPLACFALGALFFVFCPRTYRSEARLFLRVGRESVGIDPTATTGQTMQLYTSDRKEEVKSVEGVFRGRSVAAQVVDKLGPDVLLGREDVGGPHRTNFVASLIRMPIDALTGMIRSLDPISDREEAINRVQQNLSVVAERQTPVIVVQYKADSPQLAQVVCQAVVEVAQQEHMRVHRNEEARLFFEEQQERLRRQLDESLESLRTAKNEMGLGSVKQRLETLEAQYNAVALDRLNTNQQLTTSQARIQDLELQLTKIPERLITSTRSVPNNGADMLRDRFYELQVKSADLAARYSSTHPLVVAVNEQKNQAEKVLTGQSERRTETTDEINPIHRDLTLAMKQELSVVSGLKARLAVLDQQTQGVLADLRAVNQHDLELDKLARDSDLARDKYLQYARNMEEARIDQALEYERISNIAEVQQATLTEKPVVPSRLVTAAGTLLFAAAGTLAIVLFAERKHSSAPVSAPAVRRSILRHRVRREHVANGQSETVEMPASAK